LEKSGVSMCDPDTCSAAKRERAKIMRELKRFVKNNPCPNYVSRNGVDGSHK